MPGILKKYPHNPPHLFIDKAFYFITGGTLYKKKLLTDNSRKQILFDTIKKWFGHFGWSLTAWVILDNHYHIMVQSKLAKDMPKIIARVHGSSSKQINRLDNSPGRKVWWNYWDTCIRDDSDHENRLAYLHWNPVKHRLVSEPDNYQWSSYTQDQITKKQKIRTLKYKPNSSSKEIFDDFD